MFLMISSPIMCLINIVDRTDDHTDHTVQCSDHPTGVDQSPSTKLHSFLVCVCAGNCRKLNNYLLTMWSVDRVTRLLKITGEIEYIVTLFDNMEAIQGWHVINIQHCEKMTKWRIITLFDCECHSRTFWSNDNVTGQRDIYTGHIKDILIKLQSER